MPNYPLETKLTDVKDYLNGVESIRYIAKKYSWSKTMLHRWVSKYQHHGTDAFQEPYTDYTIEFIMAVLNYMNEMGASSKKLLHSIMFRQLAAFGGGSI